MLELAGNRSIPDSLLPTLSLDSPKTGQQSFPTAAIYEGVVRHRRLFPVERKFDFKLFLFFLDVDQIQESLGNGWMCSTAGISFSRFREKDYLKSGNPNLSLRQRVEARLNEEGIAAPIDKVFLLTQLSYLGFSMNPISIYYCYTGDGTLKAIIAEVNNTPWGEQHTYVVAAPSNQQPDTAPGRQKVVVGKDIKKTFHVSPFMSLDMFYRMKFSRPDSNLVVRIENYVTKDHHPIERRESDLQSPDSNRIHEVTMKLQRVDITSARLKFYLGKYPLISFKVFFGIYWQALRMFIGRRIPFYPHPKKLPPSTTAQPNSGLEEHSSQESARARFAGEKMQSK